MDELLQLGLMMEIHENGKTYVGLNSKGKALGYLMISWIERDLEVLSHA